MTCVLSVRRLEHGAGLPLPRYETAGAAGMDLLAAHPADDPIVLEPSGRALVPTGLAIQLPPGFEAQIRPRSGLALRHGVTLLNAPGTIDADYRGEIQIIMINHGHEAFTITRGMRIAQMIVAPVVRAEIAEVREIDSTERGVSGFGSTGLEGIGR